MKPASIRSKMILITLFPIAMMGGAATFTTYNAVNLASVFQRIFERNLFLAEVSRSLDSAQANLFRYLSTKNSDSLKEYIHFAQRLDEQCTLLESRVIADEEALLEHDTRSLLQRFLAFGEAAIAAKRASRPNEYLEQYGKAETVAAAIRHTVGLLEDVLLDRRLEVLSNYSTRLIAIQRLDIILVGILGLLDLLFVIYFSVRLTDPIIHLSSAAARIAAGNFDGPDINVESKDEIGAMTEVFNSMKAGIARYVDAIRSNAEIEGSLMEQRLKNLEMTNLLRHAELGALQSRINPHFLFNTMNAGIQLATLERADRTRIFLENLAAMMRYSTRDLDGPATLAEEFASIESYLYLSEIRFPGRIRADIQIDDEVTSTPIPKMTIQPLVENSLRHGFTDDVPNPTLSLRAYREGAGTVVRLEDNGVGFMPGSVPEIMTAVAEGNVPVYRDGGEESMGLVNVIRRLRLFTGRDDALVIDDDRRIGARIDIRIPDGAGV